MLTHGIGDIGNLLPHDRPVPKGGSVAEPNTAQRKAFAKMGIAMPDGSYYIRNAGDLDNAIQGVGRATPNTDAKHNSVRVHIIKRAAALRLSDKIPANWNSDGSLKHTDIEMLIKHFGVKGMKWGVRRSRSSGSSRHPVSPDASKASALKGTVRKHGTSALSNADLQHLVTRLNLERQHSQLNPAHVSTGKKILDELLGVGGNVAKQQATSLANQYAAEGIKALTAKAGK
jgi:hypothetical protein